MAYSLSGERPAAAAWPAVVFAAVWRALAEAGKVRRRRVGLAELLEMDDYRLWDLGISRYDLTRALRSDAFDMDAVRDQGRRSRVLPPR